MEDNIYSKLGVKTYINACGIFTVYGGSTMLPQVCNAIREASRHYVDLKDLHEKITQKIATLLEVEAAFISCGAAAGIVTSVAACIAGKDPFKIRLLPNTDKLEKNEIIILKSHHNHYVQQIRQGGGIIVEIGQNLLSYEWEISNAITNKTAAVFYFAESENLIGSLPLKTITDIAHSKGIPVVVNAAGELPPKTNFKRFLEIGADLVIFSGGKDIRGPQSSGLILGKRELIDACISNSYLSYGIGRPMKVDKETMVALFIAIKLYMAQNFEKEMENWHNQVDYIVKELSVFPHIKVYKDYPTEYALDGVPPKCVPRAYINWDKNKVNLSEETFIKLLREGEPGILISSTPYPKLALNPHMLNDGEEKIIVEKIKNIFQQFST